MRNLAIRDRPVSSIAMAHRRCQCQAPMATATASTIEGRVAVEETRAHKGGGQRQVDCNRADNATKGGHER